MNKTSGKASSFQDAPAQWLILEVKDRVFETAIIFNVILEID